MKIIFEVALEFNSWFDKNREPKTNEDWAKFFQENMFESGIIGEDYDDYQDMVDVTNINVKVLNLTK